MSADIDTIREALRIAWRETDAFHAALAALERVSALNSEMEDVLKRIVRDRLVTLAPREVSDAFACLLKSKESR